MRYPIFLFDGDDLVVYDTPDQHWNHLEAYDVEYSEFLFDSDGRFLAKSDAGNDRVTISDSGDEADPERLRSMLIHALQQKGQEWSDDAPLESLIPAAQAVCVVEHIGIPIGQAITNLLRRLQVWRRT